MTDLTKEFVMAIYDKCHDHLKEQTTKRDQVIAFYLVVLSFYFGSYSSLSTMLGSNFTPILLNFVMVLIGGLVIRILSGLRSWHMQYSDAIIFINKFIISGDVTKERLKQESLINFAEREIAKKDYKRLFHGIENRIILGIILISGLTVVMLTKSLFNYFHYVDKRNIALFQIILYFLYVIFHIVTTIIVLDKSKRQKTWITNFG